MSSLPTIETALDALDRRLLAARNPDGYWTGGLSSSALSTATAAAALTLHDAETHREQIDAAGQWLADHQNADGGWGDTPVSRSNLSTTLLALAAIRLAGVLPGPTVTHRSESYLVQTVGVAEGPALAGAVLDAYGSDRSFSVPILSLCAISGLLGPLPHAWRHVPPLPLELAILPHRLLRPMRIPVVSYAMPVLIAIGASTARFSARGPVKWLRRAILPVAMRKLSRIQPPSGGFLEAAPLTAFAAMNLIAAGREDHPTVERAVAFLLETVRPDGSWPIDTDLSTWLTSLSVCALGGADGAMTREQCAATLGHLLACQCSQVHPYTGAAGGGWAWTNLSGGVPDADDTAAAMLAMTATGSPDRTTMLAAADGARWLLGLQNRDGGLPTFCRGWGTLPFDRSCADITAHAIRAWRAWMPHLAGPLQRRLAVGIERAVSFLAASQSARGWWRPLWFGNEASPDQANRTYGTARVILGLRCVQDTFPAASEMIRRATGWMLAAQNDDGGWGGDTNVPSSVEETAVAVEALAGLNAAAQAGGEYLIAAVDRPPRPEPIGLYFARLWYSEKLYPLIFTTAALRALRRSL